MDLEWGQEAIGQKESDAFTGFNVDPDELRQAIEQEVRSLTRAGEAALQYAHEHADDAHAQIAAC